jgi:hypothetical protein
MLSLFYSSHQCWEVCRNRLFSAPAYTNFRLSVLQFCGLRPLAHSDAELTSQTASRVDICDVWWALRKISARTKQHKQETMRTFTRASSGIWVRMPSVREVAERAEWPSGLRRGSAVDRLLGLLVRIPSGAWMSISCECFILSGRGLCEGPIPRPEESYRLWRVTVCDM